MAAAPHMLRPIPVERIHDRRHVYHWPDIAPFELERVTSVTTILGGGIPKPALNYWYAKMVAERAVDNVDKIADWVEHEEYSDALDYLQKAPNASRDSKADMGTIVHAALEEYVSGVPQEESLDEQLEARNKRLTAKQIKAAHGYFKSGRAFLNDWKPKALFTECPIFSRTHHYAGTADLIGHLSIPGVGDDVPLILDFKTGKAVYNEMGLQLCAYSRGDFIGMEDGSEYPVPPLGIRDGIIIRLQPGGRYQAAHFRLGDDLFELFLHCKAVALRDTALDSSRGRDLPRPERGQPPAQATPAKARRKRPKGSTTVTELLDSTETTEPLASDRLTEGEEK